MAFLIFNGPFDYYSGEDFGFNYVSNITGTPDTWTVGRAPTQQYRTYQLNTTGIGALELIPDISVSYTNSAYGTGVNGVATYLTFTPSGSIIGPSVRVIASTGVFAHNYDFALATTQFVSDINAHADRGDNVLEVYINFVKAINQLQSPGLSAAQSVANYFHANAASLAVQAGGVFADLARDAQEFERVANEWATPVYFLDTGAGYKQVSSLAFDFGVDLTTVNGANATWAVNGTGGAVTVTGFTVVGHYYGDPNYPSTGSHGYYDFFDADMDGWLDVTSYSLGHNQTVAISQLISQPLNGKIVSNYTLWETGSGGAQLLVNGVAQNLQQNITISSFQLSQVQYKTGSGSDTLWVKFGYADGTSSGWDSVGIAAPVNTGPVLAVASLSATHGQVFSASTLVRGYSDPFGDPAVKYDFWNSGTGGGYFQQGILAPFAPNQDVIVTAAALSQLQYHSGSGSDTLWVRAFDGTVWGPWSPAFTVTAPINRVPQITASDISPAKNSVSLSAASMFTTTDGDGDAVFYQLWDSTSGAGSGAWLINGAVQGKNVAINVTASQLAQTTFKLPTAGSDDLWVRANDGFGWTAWKEFHVSAPANHAPVSQATDFIASHVQVLPATALFGTYDADNDGILAYQLWDSSAESSSGYWTVGGITQGTNVTINITAAQLASTSFKVGFTTDDLWVRAFDGTAWGAWKEFHSLPVADALPVITAPGYNASHGQNIAATSLFSVSDADHDAITQYQFWDSTADPLSGHFVVGGATQASNASIDVTSAQLASTTFQSGSGSDQLWVRAYDGFAWSSWKEFYVNAPLNRAPAVTAFDFPAAHNQNIAASSLFSVSDADGDAITTYRLWDSTSDASSGHWVVGGVAQGANRTIEISAAQRASTTFQSGSGSDDLWVQVYDGMTWSAWKEFHVNAPIDRAPVVSAIDRTLAKNSIAAVSSLFSVTDADNDAIAAYHFWDSTADVFSGHFAIAGVAQGTNQNINVSAAQLSQTTFLTGILGDDLWVQAFDGIAWSAWKEFHILV